MREELLKLSVQIRHAVAQRLCTDLALDEDDLRSILRREIEDSLMADPDGFLRENVMGKIKNEIYAEVSARIQSECREFWREFYRTDEEFLSTLRSELRSELSDDDVENLRQEARDELIQTFIAEMRSDPAVLADELTNRMYAEIKASLSAEND